MEKRTILAIIFSMLILLGWSTLVTKLHLVENKEVTQKETTVKPTPLKTQEIAAALPEQQPQTPAINFSQPKFNVAFNESEATIKEVVFPTYLSSVFPLKQAFLIKNTTKDFKQKSTTANTISFVSSGQDVKITKSFNFTNHNYTIDLDIMIENTSAQIARIKLPVVLGALEFNNQMSSRFYDVVISSEEKITHQNGQKNKVIEGIKFLCLRDRYFAAIIQPQDVKYKYSAFIQKLNSKESEVGIESQELEILPGQTLQQKFSIYLGPQELKTINDIRPEWSAIIYYGMFDVIAHLLLQTLGFIYSLVHNWGWAIIILSLAIYLLLYPLTLKQMRSMKEMQVLQPKIEALRNAHKDNPQRLNKEIMELYREHKVNPLGGCLPMILQLPIFLALYQALMRSIELKGATFLWIKDLSEPDKLASLPQSLPVLGSDVNILPVVIAILMFVQQKLSLAVTSGSSAEQQKMMVIIFPILFGVLFYQMPSGLVLYWLINSILMLTYQIRIKQAK